MHLTRKTWIAAAASAVASATIPAVAGAPPPAHSPSALREDLAWLVKTMLEVGVKPFAYVDRNAWMARRDGVMATMTSPMSVWDFWLHAGPLFAALNDGHAGVAPLQAYKAARTGGALGFPLIADVHPEGLFVAQRTIDDIPPGTQLLAIDGVDSASIVQTLLGLTGGQSPSLRMAFAGGTLGVFLYATGGERPSYTVRLRFLDGRTELRAVAAMSRPALLSALKTLASPQQPNYTFNRLAGGRVGYMNYLRCEDYDAFAKFLTQTCREIRKDPVDGLVVDIRSNGGGDSDLNDALWQAISDKPFVQFGATQLRVSDRLKREYGREKYVKIYGPQAWTARNGSILTSPGDAPEQPKPDPLRYNGPVYLLIGPGTFSSAMECAAAAKDFALATVVGQETGEPVNSTGEIYTGKSPNTGLSFAFTTKYFMGPKPQPDGQGVVPDVTVVPTDADLRAGRDVVLDYAVGKIANKS